MKLTKQEQETIIRWDEASETTTVYTYNVKLQNRFMRFLERHPELAVLKSSDGTGAMTFELPKKRLAVYPIDPPSEQQRQAARERMLQRHSAKTPL